ncbi:plastocyanin [compost metagenome]
MNMNRMKLFLALATLATAGAAFAGGAHLHAASGHNHGAPAASGHKEGAKHQGPFGQAGDPEHVTRNVHVFMGDQMRFEPALISVKQGETVRFVVSNAGAMLHEMVLGTVLAHGEHAAQMREHPGMEHDAPNMAHVKPGATGQLVWQFTEPGEFQFACLVPGHYEAGMTGKVVVE